MKSFHLNIETSSIEGLERVTFDAEFRTSIRGETVITSYPTEEGFVITNGIINQPEIVRVSLGVGVKKLTGLLSDPLEALTSNWTAYLAGLISNYVDSGVVQYLLNRFSGLLIEPDSRQGQLYITMQVLRLTGATVNLVIHNIGTMKNFNIKSVEFSRSDRDDFLVDVTLQQRLGKTQDLRVIDTAGKTINLGEVTTKEDLEL